MYSSRKKIKLTGKTASHRDALLRSQVTELIRSYRIKTTPSKGKALSRTFDRLVTEAKKETVASKRRVSSFFGNNEKATNRLFSVISEKLTDRNSGYTRLIKTLPRAGDNAEQVYVMLVNTEIQEKKTRLQQLVERNDNKNTKKPKQTFKPKDDQSKSGKNVQVKDSSKGIRRVATS